MSDKSNPPQQQPPVEPVRLIGGGGGQVKGQGDGPNRGAPEDGGQKDAEDDVTIPGLNEKVPALPELNQAERKQIAEKFDPEDVRLIEKSNNEMARSMAKLEDNVRKKLSEGVRSSKGGGGTGEGGGKDKGKDTGKGDQKGPGESKATLTQREKRMLRWNMRFTAHNGVEYVAQLRSLGAILAFPVNEGPNPEYQLVRDLRPGAKLLNEDLSSIQRIYWIDDKPQSVRDVVNALGLKINPSRFVAFMPEELEQDLYKMEKGYIEHVLKRKKFDEEDIDETHFQVVFKGGKYRPELQSVTMKR